MPNLFFPWDRFAQPGQSVRLNERWARYKPTLIWTATSYLLNAANGRKATLEESGISGKVLHTNTPYGRALYGGVAGAQSFRWSQDAIGNGDVTVIMHGAPIAAADNKIALFQVGSVGSVWFGANTDQNLGNVSGTLCLGLLQTGVNRSSIQVSGAIDGTLSGYVIKKTGATGAAWKNGQRQTVTTTGTLTGAPTTASDTVEVIGSVGNGSYSFEDPLISVYVFQSALPDELCAELSIIQNGWQLFEPEPVHIYWPSAGGGSDTSITPSAGATTLVGYAPTLLAPVSMTPGVGTLSLTGIASSLSTAFNLTPNAGTLSIAGYASALTQNTSISPGATDLALLGAAPGLIQGFLLTPGAGALSLTGYTPSLSSQGALTPTDGTLTLVGYQPGVAQQTFIVPGVGALTLGGLAPSVAGAGTLIPGETNLTLVGYQPSVTQQTFIVPGVGAITVDSSPPLVVGSTYIVPGVGSATFVGYSPSVGVGTVITPSAGELLLSGRIPSVVTDSGSLSITPPAGSLGFVGYAPTSLTAVFVDGNGRVFWLPAQSVEWILKGQATEWILR